ncbi:hypothetical protein GCM10028802_11160 [Terrabacter terrigena]
MTVPAGSMADLWEAWVQGSHPPPQCHGVAMEFRAGISKRGNSYRGFFCTVGRRCTPLWVPKTEKD